MAAQLTPSMPLIEQLLRDKNHLSDTALKNARALIQRYVDQLAEVLRLQVMKAVKGKLDRRDDVPNPNPEVLARLFLKHAT